VVIVPPRSYIPQGSVLQVADTWEQKTKIESLAPWLWRLVVEPPDLISSGMKCSAQFTCYTFTQTKLETTKERDISWKIGRWEEVRIMFYKKSLAHSTDSGEQRNLD